MPKPIRAATSLTPPIYSATKYDNRLICIRHAQSMERAIGIIGVRARSCSTCMAPLLELANVRNHGVSLRNDDLVYSRLHIMVNNVDTLLDPASIHDEDAIKL